MAAVFTIKRGDAWNQDFIYREGDENGPPLDLTSVSAALHLKESKSKTLVLDAAPYLTVNGIEGTVTVSVPKSVTRSFPIGDLKFDVELSIDVPSTESMILRVIEDVTALV